MQPKQILKTASTQEEMLEDVLSLIDNSDKVLASVGKENPFDSLELGDQLQVFDYLQSQDIYCHSSPPWVADGYFQGLTVFYKKQKLQEIIDSNKDMIVAGMWPRNADHFAMKVCFTIADANANPDMYRLIAYCFNDLENPFVQEFTGDYKYSLAGFKDK